MGGLLSGLLRAGRRVAPAELPTTLTIGDRAVPLKVRRHPTARRLILRLDHDGALQLTVPSRISARAALDFLDRHRDWAGARLADRPRAAALGDGFVLPVRGEPTRIVHEPRRRGAMLAPPEALGQERRLLVGGDIAHLPRRVRDLLIREARRDLDAAVERHAQALGVRPSALTLKDTRSRWGSCTATRRLSFSWRIVLAPPFVLDYLAAHEVAHLCEMNHGPAFWALCRTLCPRTDEGRAWLKREGVALHAFDFG